MHKLSALLIFLLSARLIHSQCTDLISEFCSSQETCPTQNLLSIGQHSLPYSEFNAICFGNFESQGGDIQGRVLIQGNMNVTRGFSIGVLLTEGQEFPYSLVVGGNALWGSGSLSPYNGSMYVGGEFSGASEISQRRTGGPCTTANCLATEFERAKSYFMNLSDLMSSLMPNVMIDSVGNLMCNNLSQAINVLEINGIRELDLIQHGSQISGCNLDTIFVINIKGTFDVNLTGSGFWQTKKVIYNVIGQRILRVTTQVDGLVLAPNVNLLQRGGVIVGNVIAGTCRALQFNLACIPPVGQLSGGSLSGGASSQPIPQVPSRNTESAIEETQLGTQSSQSSPSSQTEISETQTNSQSNTNSRSQSATQSGTRSQSATQSGTRSQSATQSQTVILPGVPSQSQTQSSQTQTSSPQGTSTTSSATVGTSTPSSSCIPLWESGFQCEGFSLPFENSTISFQDFDVIVFGNMSGNTGDIQGNAIVGDSVNLGRGFSIGDKLPANSKYALIVGGLLRWESGALLPNLSSFYAGNIDIALPFQILLQRIRSSCLSGRCLTQYFNRAYECYSSISLALSRLPTNAEILVENSRALVTCNSRQDNAYVVNISARNLSRVLWYEFENCNQGATWVVNVIGNESVVFQGGSFPARPNSLVFNIPGENRNVTVQNAAVLGSILAPASNVMQPGGVIVGKVIARNLQVLQVSRAGCNENSDGTLREGNSVRENMGISLIPALLLILAAAFL